MNSYRNILVIQTAFPGDIVLTTPLFRALKKHYPLSRISLVTTPPGRDLLEEIREIDEIITYDKKGKDRGPLPFLRLLHKLRKKRFDLAISPHRSARSAFLCLASNIARRIGYSESAFAFLYTHRVYRNSRRHEVERILSLLKPLGIRPAEEDKEPYLELSSVSEKRMTARLEGLGIKPDELIIGIAPGSVWNTKRWTPEGYASLIDRLTETYAARILLLGAPSDREAGDAVMSKSRHRPANLIGQTSLQELIAVIDRCRLFIGNDSAPGHIAAARKVPVISIFGPTVPAFGYAPYGSAVMVVEKALPCRPCHHHGPQVCPETDFRCMKEITPDDIIPCVEKLMGHSHD